MVKNDVDDNNKDNSDDNGKYNGHDTLYIFTEGSKY